MDTSASTISPTTWAATLAARPVFEQPISGTVPALVRRWAAIPPDIDQAALDQHYLSVHLGGAKRLHRAGDGRCLTRETRDHAHSVIPAGAAFQWRTEGPIDFAHFYFDPLTVERFVASSFDRDPGSVRLQECLGESQPVIDAIAAAVLTEVASTDGVQQAYLDDLMHLLLFQVLRCYSNAPTIANAARMALAPYRLRSATEYIEAHLAEPIGVGEIAAAAGMSAFHFSRAFRAATGKPPYAYLLDRRIATAKARMGDPQMTLAAIAQECGFNSAGQFSRMFRAATGCTPSVYRHRL